MQHRKCLCVMHHTTWQQGRYEGKRIKNVSRLKFDAFHLDKNDKYFIRFSKRISFGSVINILKIH